jgi:Predicted RNA binding protein (contains ribosomal protein S1 domain)
MALTAGSILDGTVINITNFGAFVEVEGKTGLVHISEISDTYVKDIREYLKEKDKVRVKVISIDDNGKISLSIKQASVSQKPIDIDWSVDNSYKHVDFEERISKFMKDSEERMQSSKKYKEMKTKNYKKSPKGVK